MKNNQTSLPREKARFVLNLYSNGQFQEAVDKIKSLNESYPMEPLLFNLIGACYKELGQLEGAAKMFEVAVSIKPNYAEAHFNLGVSRKDLGQIEAAIESYKQAIIITPNYPDAHNNLGKLLFEDGQYKLAIESLEWAVAYKYDFYEAHNNLGNALNEYGNVEASIKSFEKALEHNPQYDKAYLNLALVFKDLGNQKDFLKNINKAISIKPDWSDAHLHLSRVKKYKKNDPQLAQIHSFLNATELSVKDRINYNFTLAKVYEDLENHEEQFRFLNEANKLRKKEANYFFDKDQKLFSIIKEVFENPPTIISKSLSKTTSIRPIFILGMPRSGTSLVHQIIDSHNEVYGAGELRNLNKAVTPFLRKYTDKKSFTQKDLTTIRESYLDALSSLNASENIIIDKMPLNFRYIGFILSAFPEAKILHMNRDPIATCWSIYKFYFPGNAYSYSQKDIANYYGLYKNLMGFWHKLFPNKIFDICYEDLTKNQELETRKILQYCDLEWDESCLDFHKNKKVMKTTSALQVREKIYQGSSEVWRKYEAYLQPLINGLNKY
ncbi:sulfotransferase [Candidatus Thioglobus sp.]|nr:sulfotransferase [Candidatus Thioglobus sp.]